MYESKNVHIYASISYHALAVVENVGLCKKVISGDLTLQDSEKIQNLMRVAIPFLGSQKHDLYT